MAADIVACDELNCALCGGCELEASCPEHGPQENATIHNEALRCIEWSFERGDECWERLEVVCASCGSSAVEGLEAEEP